MKKVFYVKMVNLNAIIYSMVIWMDIFVGSIHSGILNADHYHALNLNR
jgi:hypothetical protein